MKIIEVIDHATDYPYEHYVGLPRMTAAHALKVAEALNDGFGASHPNRFKVVPNDYVRNSSAQVPPRPLDVAVVDAATPGPAFHPPQPQEPGRA